MPLTNVRDLVAHASRHGYMVASFKVHSADEIQSVVTAAEANRAPAIIAMNAADPNALHHDIHITVAESVAARAGVPIGIELESDLGAAASKESRYPATSVSIRERSLRGDPLLFASDGVDAGTPAHGRDIECWLPAVAAPCSASGGALVADRIGVPCHANGKILRTAALKAQLQRFQRRFDRPLVVDGDARWPDSVFHSLPQMGVAKINFDRRLHCVMAQANRKAAQSAGDDYRRAVEHVSAALEAEIAACLRRTSSTGRAADVVACARAAQERQADDNEAAAIYRPAQRRGRAESISSGNARLHLPVAEGDRRASPTR